MASTPVFSSVRRRKSPLAGAFFAPVHLTGIGLIRALENIAIDLISAVDPLIPFQRRNTRSLVGKVKVFLSLFEFLRDSPPQFSDSRVYSATNLCLKELYIVIYRCKILLDYCNQSSRLWLLLRNSQISGYFHDLTQEISTLLDVFPADGLGLSADVKEQIALLRKQARRSKLYIEPRDDALLQKLHAFLDEFEFGRLPDTEELRVTFITQLGIRDAGMCRMEIEFLEEQIYNQEEEGDLLVHNGVVALTRYCRFLLFETGVKEGGRCDSADGKKKPMKGMVCQGIGETFATIPKEFCCPISLDLMRDPVIASTGQTYDRTSITRWLEEGRNICPNSGQTLTNTHLVPNHALQSLISHWCSAHGVEYYPPETSDASAEFEGMSRAALEANKATTNLLIKQLSMGSDSAKEIAVRELRLLAKTGKENRACIAEVGAIPLLQKLLSSSCPSTQENSVTAILNLSILESNKSRIVEEVGCLKSIVNVLRHGWTEEARENAAAALFSLSAIHEYKLRITDEDCALEALAALLRDGSPRGKKDAIMALFNLSTHVENCKRMVDSGAASALAEAVNTEGVAEEASGALALLVRQPVAAETITRDTNAVMGLVGVMKRGSPKAKENALAALVEICRNGGDAVTEKVASTPSLFGLIQTLLFTGTKRARRKAASLARMFRRHEASGSMPFGGWALQYALARSRPVRRGSNLDNSDASVVSISVPVL